MIIICSVPILADSHLVGIDDNSDDNRADMQRYVTVYAERL